jgi:hypothetical protein
MPTVIIRRSAALSQAPATPARETETAISPRRRRIAEALAASIAEIRNTGSHSNTEIAERLNARGLRAPSGRFFSRETVRRIQMDIKLLGLGDAPRTRSAALRARADRERARKAAQRAALVARRNREHPDWDLQHSIDSALARLRIR